MSERPSQYSAFGEASLHAGTAMLLPKPKIIQYFGRLVRLTTSMCVRGNPQKSLVPVKATSVPDLHTDLLTQQCWYLHVGCPPPMHRLP